MKTFHAHVNVAHMKFYVRVNDSNIHAKVISAICYKNS